MRTQGLILLCLFASFEVSACEDGEDQSISPYVKLDGEFMDGECTVIYLYTPEMNGADTIQTISFILGDDPKSIIPIDYVSAGELEAEFRSANHVVSDACLTAEMIGKITVSATYHPVPDEKTGAIALCFSSREFPLSEVNGL